jgi:hypothetical protein
MDPDQGSSGRPLETSTTTSTTTTHGPYTTTTIHSTEPGQGTSVTHYGDNSTTITNPAVTTVTRVPVPQSPAPPSPAPSRSVPQRIRSSSIQLRRPSAQDASPSRSPPPQQPATGDSTWEGGRRRSSSEPRPPSTVLFADDHDLRRQMTATPLQPLYEDGAQRGPADNLAPPTQNANPRRQGMQRQISALNIRRNNRLQNQHNTMDANVVDVLDVIGTHHHLQNCLDQTNVK